MAEKKIFAKFQSEFLCQKSSFILHIKVGFVSYILITFHLALFMPISDENDDYFKSCYWKRDAFFALTKFMFDINQLETLTLTSFITNIFILNWECLISNIVLLSLKFIEKIAANVMKVALNKNEAMGNFFVRFIYLDWLTKCENNCREIALTQYKMGVQPSMVMHWNTVNMA